MILAFKFLRCQKELLRVPYLLCTRSLQFTNTIYLNVKRPELVELFIFQLKRSACASENLMCWFKKPPLFMFYIK